jgi:hypothetical protein
MPTLALPRGERDVASRIFTPRPPAVQEWVGDRDQQQIPQFRPGRRQQALPDPHWAFVEQLQVTRSTACAEGEGAMAEATRRKAPTTSPLFFNIRAPFSSRIREAHRLNGAGDGIR